jgi:arginyl-tRNA synthetase
MKTRSGDNVPLKDVLDEAIVRAGKIIEEKNSDLEEKKKETSPASSPSAR